MNCKRLLQTVVLPALLLLSFTVFGQQTIKVTGRVTDAKDDSGITGVSIVVKGTSTGTSSDATGSFSLQAPANGTLVFSSVGYSTREVAVSAVMNVSLVATASTTLNEVVVIAYGSKKKSDLTGAVTSVGAKDFQKGNINSSEQLLQGKVPGLQVTTGGGAAGGGSRIRIRSGASLNASNDPLIVIDGVPVDGNGLTGSANLLNTINPNDIESMSVLKDASATALYGSRASNGVIIITTKKGSKGKVKLNFNTMISAGQIAKKLDVYTGDEIREILNADAAATGNNTWKDLMGSSNTDWQDQVYQTAMGYDNNLSASGAIGSIPFRASMGYLNQDGLIRTNNFGRISTALNLTPKFFNNHLSVNVSFKGSWTNNRFVDEGGVVGSAASFDPTQEVRTENKFGNYWEWMSGSIPNSQATRNPLGLIMLRQNTSDVNRQIGNIQLDYKLHFLPELHVLVNAGMDRSRGSGLDVFDSTSATNYLTAGRTSE
jgi:TonB-linked SusC/RagA family outer membrane protein